MNPGLKAGSRDQTGFVVRNIMPSKYSNVRKSTTVLSFGHDFFL
jgi:hypothetical protein